MYYRIRANKPPVVYKKIGDLFEFCIGGGLIKSGSLLTRIWYLKKITFCTELEK